MISMFNIGLTALQKFSFKKTGLVAVLLITFVSGCSSVLDSSENFYKDMPRRRINWRDYLTD
jgi:hypothetical protein